jgi:hypothetical protein
MILMRANDVALMIDTTSGKDHGEISIAVLRSIAHTAAKNDHRVIEYLCFFEPRDEVTQFGSKECFYNLKLTDTILGFAVM